MVMVRVFQECFERRVEVAGDREDCHEQHRGNAADHDSLYKLDFSSVCHDKELSYGTGNEDAGECDDDSDGSCRARKKHSGSTQSIVSFECISQ